MAVDPGERLRRWRSVLGQDAQESCGGPLGEDLGMDRVPAALYRSDRPGRAGQFVPDVHLMAAAINRHDLGIWAARNEIVAAQGA